MADVKEAGNVVTSENATTFYAERLGLADNNEPPEAESTDSEPAQVETQSEPEAEEEAKEVKAEKPKDKLNKRFDKVRKRAQEAEAEAAELRNRLKELEGRVNPQQQQAQQTQPVYDDGKPSASQFNDAFEYAEALAEWSTEQALINRDKQEAERRAQEERNKVLDSWNKRLNDAKADLPDFDDMVASSDVVVSDHIRDAILESVVGPQILYHLAENPDLADKLNSGSPISALRQIGRLEAQFERKEAPVAESKPSVARSKAPAPINPIKTGSGVVDVGVDSNGEFHGTYQQWREARKNGKVR